MVGARVFVALAFLLLGASFLLSTGILINEFRDAEWRSMVVVHSHLFFFFPVFGLLALAAFYRPAVVFTDLYWTHLRHGKLRYSLGFLAAVGLTIAVTHWLDAKPRGLYEVSANALLADRGEPAGCAGQRAACRRAPLLDTLASVPEAAQRRVGISKFARNCQPDALLEVPDEMQKERYCFPAKAKLTGTQCCEAQTRFGDTVARLQADPTQRSLSGSPALESLRSPDARLAGCAAVPAPKDLLCPDRACHRHLPGDLARLDGHPLSRAGASR